MHAVSLLPPFRMSVGREPPRLDTFLRVLEIEFSDSLLLRHHDVRRLRILRLDTFVLDVLFVGSSLFTALSATQGVRVASSCPTSSARDTCLKYSGLEFHLAAYLPGIHAHPRDAMEG